MPEVLVKQSPLYNVHASVTISPGMTVAEIVEHCRFPRQIEPLVSVFIEDVEVPRGQWARIKPKPSTLLHVCVMPAGGGGNGGKNPLVAIATLAIAVAAMAFGGPLGTALFNSVGASALGATAIGTTTLAAITGSAVISLTGMLLLSALVKPPNASDGQSAPRFSIMGSSNRANPYGLIPRVFGKTKVYPQLAAQPYTETVGDDQYLRMLLLVGHGPLKISDIRIGETPLASFQNVESQISEGGPVGWAGSTAITLYTNAVNQEDMSVLLEHNVYAVRTTSIEAAEVSVDVVFPGGLFTSDDRGRRVTRTISFEAAWRVPGGGWSVIARDDQRTTLSNAEWDRTEEEGYDFVGYDDNGNPVYTQSPIVTWIPGRFRVSGATSSAVRCGFRVKLPTGGQYEIRIKRVSGEGGDNDVDLAYLTAVRSVIYRSAINEPGLALIALRIKATQQLNGTPNQINCIVESYLPTWNPATGWSWAITRNPAWIYTDLLRRRGQATLIDDNRLDLTTLRAWAIACDATAPNASEPRWTFDGVIDGGSVFDALNRVASHGRASFVMREGKYSAVRDAGTGSIVQHITPRNSWGYRGRKQFIDQPHALRVRFVNALKGYQEDERLVFDDGYNAQNATRFETIELYGCTSSTMAWREGRYYLAIGQLRPEEHTVSMDVENLRANMGDLVMFAHDVIAVGLAQGRILSRVLSGENLVFPSLPSNTTWSANPPTPGTDNFGIAPDGTQTTYRTTGGAGTLYMSGAITPGQAYTYSVFVKTGAGLPVRMYVDGLFGPGGAFASAYADAANVNSAFSLYSGGAQAISASATATPFPDWYRLSFTFLPPSGTFANVHIYPITATAQEWWGAQLERGSSASDYTPTTNAAVLRSISGFVLDETVIMEAGKQYGLRVRQEDGTAAVLSLATVAGESNTVSLSQTASIATGPDAGDLFMFGESGREATRMLVKRIEPGPDLTAVVTLADAPDGIYTADTAQIPDFNSNITLQRLPEFERPTTPTFAVRSDESVLLRLADGTLQDRIGIFPAPVLASVVPIDGYETQFKESSTTSWQFGPRSLQEAPVVYISPVVAGLAYDIRIRSISRTGVVGKWENVAGHVVVGKTTRPSAVLNFSAASLVDGTQLSWDFPALDTDIDVVSFEIRRGDSWDTGTVVTEDFAGTTLFVAFSSGSATERFWIKATDSIGLQSLTASTVLGAAQAPADVPRLDIYPQDDRVRLAWTEVGGSGLLYEIREGETWALGRFVVRASGSTTLVQWPLQQEGPRTWWIRAYVPATGLYSVNPQFASVNQAPISNRNVVVERDFQALEFPGVLHRMSRAGGFITLDQSNGINFPVGEFFGEVDLGQDTYARNWIEMRANALAGAALPWSNATFSWLDAAGATWDGALNDATGAELFAEIFPGGYTEPELVDGYPLNGDLRSVYWNQGSGTEGGGSPVYADARFRKGMYLEDDRIAEWGIPGTGNTGSFTFDLRLTTLREIQNVFLTITSYVLPGGRLEFGYDPAGVRYFVRDSVSNRRMNLCLHQVSEPLNADPEVDTPSAWSFQTAGTFTTVVDGATGSAVIRSATVGAAGTLFTSAQYVSFDPAKTYRVRAYVRRSANADGVLYFGTALRTSAGAEISVDGSYWYYGAAAGITATTAWVEYAAIFGAGTNRTFPGNAVSMSPVAFINYNSTTGYYEIQNIIIEEIDRSRDLGDVITFGLNQTATTRTFMAASRNNPQVRQESAAIAPFGDLDVFYSTYDTQANVTTWANASGNWSAAGATWGSYAGRTGLRATLSDVAQWTTDLTPALFAQRIADPHPLGNAPGKPLLPGDYRYQTAILGLRLEDDARTNQTLSITEAHLFVDVPDVVDRGSAFVPISGTYVPFSRVFAEPPEVQAVQVGGLSRALVVVDTITTAGFFVTLFDAASPNINESGTISWSALGR